MAELERESMAKLAELETELGALKVEYSEAVEARRMVEEELTSLNRQRQDSARRQSVLESKIIELENLTGTLTKGATGKIFPKFCFKTLLLNKLFFCRTISQWNGQWSD